MEFAAYWVCYEREREREIGVMSQDIPIPTTGLSCYLWLNVSPSFPAELITVLTAQIRTPTIHSIQKKTVAVGSEEFSEAVHDGYLDICLVVDLLLPAFCDWQARYNRLNPVRNNLQVRGELRASVHLQHSLVPLYLGYSRYSKKRNIDHFSL